MKRIFSNRVVAFVLLAVTLIMLAVFIFTLAKPISYEKTYFSRQVFDGYAFDVSMVFHKDNTMTIVNSNFDEPQQSYYYLKDGYVFLCGSVNEEAYLAEVQRIEANWEEALQTPFYASKINPFTCIDSTDDMSVVRVCYPALNQAIVFGLIQFCLIGLTIVSLICSKRAWA